MSRLLFFLLPFLLSSCGGYPQNIRPVSNLDINRYMGTWYEIARLDHPFERGLEQVSAEYSLHNDKTVRVVNRGFSPDKNEWKEAVGKAYLAGEKEEGYLKVSFFGPFYSSYVIFALDEQEYQYAYVTGPDKSYLWLLARTPQVNSSIVKEFVQTSSKLGYKVENLIYVKHPN